MLYEVITKEADVDSAKLREVLNVTGNIEVALQELLKLDGLPKKWDLNQLAERKNRMFQRLTPPPGSFGPRAVLDELRNVLPDDGILTVDVGAHLHLVGQQWRTPEPDKLLMTNRITSYNVCYTKLLRNLFVGNVPQLVSRLCFVCNS